MAQKKYISLAKLGTFLTSLKTVFAPMSHTHKTSELSDYVVDTSLSSTSSNPIANKTVKTQIDSINSSITSLTNNKANATDLTSHTSNKSNPHGVTKSQVGLGSVPNVTTNDQTPTYSDATTLATLASGEKLSVAFPKIKLAITNLINHMANNSNPHSVTKSQVGLGNVDNTSDANKPISTATQTALNSKSDVGHTHTVDSAFSTTSTNPVQNKIVTAKVNSLQTSVDSKVPSSRTINGKALTDNITLSASDVGADASGTANTKVNTHNTSTSAHEDIRTLITNLTTRLNTLADSDDTTLDQMSELVAYIKANRSLIESVTSSKVNVSDIVNNLTTNVTNKPLSAAQGVAIKALIDALQTTVNGKANTSHTHTIANITNLQSTLDGKSSTSHSHDLSTMINTLSTGSSTPTDSDYYVCQYAGGGNTTTTYHRRPMSAMWTWIKSKLATVATSGSYNDLTNKPTIGNGTITITQGGTTKGTFTLNQTGNTTVALTDNNTTYSTGTASTLGLTKLYTSTGTNTDGTMTQSALKVALDEKASSSHTHNYAGSATSGGVANSATKLATTRSIGVKGGISGSSAHFDGTSDQYIDVSEVKESYLTWGGKNFSGSYGCIDAAMIPTLGANRLAFMPTEAMEIEYSKDGGTTWVHYSVTDAQKINLFNGVGTNLYIGADTNKGIDKTGYMVRVTFDSISGKLYTVLNKFAIFISTEGSTDCYCTITGRLQANYAADADTWATFADKVPISGWSGWNIINLGNFVTCGSTNNTSQYRQIRMTFGVTSHPSTVNYVGLNITKIMGFGGVGWSTPSTLAKHGRMYTFDSNQNVTFPQKIYATQFVGEASKVATYSSASDRNRPVPFAVGANNPGTFSYNPNFQYNPSTQLLTTNIDGDAATVNGHTVNSDVPSNAVFTDTNTKVTNTLATTTKAYVTGTTSASTNTGTQVFDTGVYLDTTAGRLHVDSISIGSGVVTYDSTNKCIVITP